MSATMLLLGWAIEAALGWPAWLYARVRHPVVWIGALIDQLDKTLNQEKHTNAQRLLGGALTALLVLLVTGGLAAAIMIALPEGAARILIGAIIAASLLASRSLYEHVNTVAQALNTGSLPAAREAVSHVVGRNPELLDQAGVTRAALESLAENTSDGVTAPLFWGVVLGLPGIALYKAANTLDSMIGHRNARYECFGKFSARLDDIMNWVPARLTGVLFALVSGKPVTVWRTMRRDAHRHRSVNAGWPESALAGALGIRLSGPRRYSDRLSEEPWLNETAPDPQPGDLARGLTLYIRAMLLAAIVLMLIARVGVQ
ncbi:MAG: adenosylcobinamide-phosphate synthase CbiB [Pseudomonadota bacterium]